MEPALSGFAAQHDEVVAALRAIGNPRRGEAIRADRHSQLLYLGIGFPALRARVKQGFSFSKLPEAEQLAVWDALWHASPYGDVLFAALEVAAPLVRRRIPPGFWPLTRGWAARVDNWCHSDALSAVYARVLQAQPDAVMPTLQAWNASGHEWARRLAITSLFHHPGRDAIFLAPAQMLPLLQACVPDHRRYVALALGWALRELGRVHPDVLAAFLARHGSAMSAMARARASE